MAGAVLYLAGGSAVIIIVAAVTAALDRWMPDAAWEKLFEIAGWRR